MPRTCSIARALDVLGEKWSLLVLREVFLGCRRFEQIQRNTGAPRDILAARLKTLVAHGVLTRRQYQENPPRYEYRLTPAGRELFGAITLLREWGDRHLAGGEPPATFVHRCGAVLETRLHCAACDDPLRPEDVALQAEPG